MIFDFTIIPDNEKFIDAAYYIKAKLEDIYCISLIIIDTNYNNTFFSRFNKWRQKNYNIITIDENYYNKINTINVMFMHNDSKLEHIQLKTMPVCEFLNLVVSYRDKDKEEIETTNKVKCIIV